MSKSLKNTSLMVATALAAAMTVAAVPAAQAKDKPEKCFGVAKAGHNDCATANSSCAGTSANDQQKDAWIYLPKGTCDKIAGGSLKSSK